MVAPRAGRYDRRHTDAPSWLLLWPEEEGSMNATLETTIGDIVKGDFRAAAVFQNYGIDFCCGGKRTLAEACQARQVPATDVLNEINEACHRPDTDVPQFGDWDTDTLIAYIVERHHGYVRRVLPVLGAYSRKLVSVHGVNHPELHEVARLVAGVDEEMTMHMAKEEKILFPYIARVAEAVSQGLQPPAAPFGSIDNPIRMMEADHDSTGAAVAQIRALTRDYALPADGCTTYRVCLEELETFERDLHQHVHLENNVLFPRARGFFALQEL